MALWFYRTCAGPEVQEAEVRSRWIRDWGGSPKVSAPGAGTGDFIWRVKEVPWRQAYKKLAPLVVTMKEIKEQKVVLKWFCYCLRSYF